MVFRNFSIQKKLITIMTTVSGVTILLGSMGFLALDFLMERQEMQRNIRVQAQIVAMNSRAALTFHDEDTARTILSSLAIVSSVQDAILFTPDRKVFASFTRSGHKDHHDLPRTFSQFSDHINNDGLIVLEPIILDNEEIGGLIIHATLEEFYQESWRAVLLILLVLTATLPIAFLLSYQFQKVISQPIELLRKAAVEIGQAKFDTQIDIATRDEIGDLAAAFRTMARDLAKHRTDLERANQTKSDFLANMSHEIRTPMNAMVGLTELALQTETSPRTRDYLRKIAQSSLSLLRIINDILDFSKIEAGKLELEQNPFLLRAVLSHLLDLFHVQANEKRLELVMVFSEEYRLELVGDALRLEQVLINLLSNALKFTEQGEIELRVETLPPVGEEVVLKFSVRDTGIGMTAEQVQKLFAPFSQGDTSTTRKYGGTGLGLSICQRLTTLMGGDLWAESQAGHGTIFYFTARFRLSPRANDETMIPPPEMAGLKSLVISDHEAVRHALLGALGVFGFAATGVSSVPEALAQVKHALAAGSPYLLVVMDWLTPDMEALDALQKLVELCPKGQAPKRLLLTPYHREKEIRPLATTMGVEACLTKPIHGSHLFDAIMTAFGKEVTKSFQLPVDAVEITPWLGGARILLVEDNAINQQVAKEILEGIGLIVTVARHGEEAVEMATTSDFDAVLMDIQMPVMDGYTATQRIRKNGRCQNLPIIAMTAHAMVGDREKSLAAGMNDHVVKPISRKELFAALTQWIAPRERPILSSGCAIANQESHGLPQTLPGIDMSAALARINGNRSLFRRLLLEFQGDYGKVATKIRADLATPDQNVWEAAGRMVHALKGMAGNISADTLFHAAHGLETEIGQGWQGGVPAAMDHFDRALQQVMAGIVTWMATENATTCEPVLPLASLDRESLVPIMGELAELLDHRNVEAQRRFAILKSSLVGVAEVHKELEHMEETLARYDFATARTILSQLAQSLDVHRA